MLTRILSETCRLQKVQPLLTGVSGGPDSLYLLHQLWKLGYQPIAAYFNHHLRPEAEAEAKKVQGFARQWGIPFRFGSADVKSLAKQQSLSVEEAARHARYQFLFTQAGEDQAQAVAVAHNADDQVETLLLHLIQGTGLAGLQGMTFYSLPNPWSQVIPLVRPLLSTWRVDIVQYLDEQGLEPAYDASNQSPEFLRNRVRLELLPYLETYNPAIRQTLWRTGSVVAQDYGLLEELMETAWEQVWIESYPQAVALYLPGLRALSPALLRLLLRRAVRQIAPGLRAVGYSLTHQAAEFIRLGANGSSIELAGSLTLLLEGDRLWVAGHRAELPSSAWPQLESGAEKELPAPGLFSIGEDWLVEVEVVPLDETTRQTAIQNSDPYQAWFDRDKLPGPVRLRTRKAGDRIRLLGMQGSSMKISDLMINLKVPQRARARWPLVTTLPKNSPEEDILLWVPGLRASEQAPLDPTSRVALHLRVQPRRQGQ